MTDEKQSLPQIVIDEAWSEFLYPRSAVGELAQPSPHSGFVRAVRVFQKWVTEHDQYWSAVYDGGRASELELMAHDFARRATERDARGLDAGPECDGECETSDCHTVSSCAAWTMAAAALHRQAAALRASSADGETR